MSTFSDSFVTALQLVTTGDAGLWSIVVRSLAVSATACLIACSIGLLLGAWLAVARFAGRGVVLTILNTFLAIPSVVVGLVIYLLLSRSGPLGFLGWLFSERGGREHGVGLFVSRPLGGTYRSATVELEGARAAGAEAAARQVRREVAETAERDVAAVETGLIAWRAAQVSARAAQAAADRTRRAFELGERDIADSLQAQRQGLEAQRAEIAARAAAWRALALLRIDAHDLWAEQHED